MDLTGLVDGRAGYRGLLSRLATWRVGLRWYAMAILPAPLVAAGVLFALSLPSPVLTDADKAVVFLAGLGAALTTILEEIGWTGFVMPRLRRHHSILMTGMIVGALWGFWHFLQQIFISGTYAGAIPPLLFVMLSVFAAVATRLSVLWKVGRALFGRPESSIFDLPNLVRGFRFSMDAMWTEASRLNLLKLVPMLKMPVVIFVGRRDHWVPPETSVAFFDALAAPSKKLVWFEHSGHEAFVDEAEKFNLAMVELVRPLAAVPVAEPAPARLPVSA